MDRTLNSAGGQPVQTFPSGFTRTVLATDFSITTSFRVAPDGCVFIAAQDGVIRVWTVSEGLSPTPYHIFTTNALCL